MPSTPTTVAGVVSTSPSTLTWRPAGLVWKVIVVVRGTMSRVFSLVRPSESTASRWMRYQTLGEVSPVVGITNEPLAEPVVGGMNG
jgi:hypothetical protein